MPEKYLDESGLSHVWDKIKGVLPNGAYYVAGSGSTAAVTSKPYYSARWRGSNANITSLYSGLMINYKLDVAGNGSYYVVLDVNGLGEHPVCSNVNSTISTKYGVGCIVPLVYDATQTASAYINANSATTITGVWKMAEYDSTITYRLTNYYYNPKPITALYRYQFLFSNYDLSHVIPANTVDNKTSTYTKALTTEGFDPFGPIYYYASTTTVAAEASIGSNTTAAQYLTDLRYSFNINSSGTAGTTALTAGLPVFIKAKYNKTTHLAYFEQDTTSSYYLTRSSLTQTLPVSNPNADAGQGYIYIYIYLGQAYNKYQMDLFINHPVYYWNTLTGKIDQMTGASSGVLDTTATTAQSTNASESLEGNITLHKIAKTGTYSDLIGTPNLATVATSGSYNDLADKPSIPAAQVNADWNSTSGISEILNKPTLATVATSGSYNDLTNRPTIPSAPGTLNTTATTAQSTSSSEALSGSITLHKIAKTGTYSDLIGKPTLGTAAAKDTTNTYSATGTDPITGTGVAAALATLPTPMQFKGTVGSSGTIEWSALPTAAAGNTGYVYKVISDHSTTPVCKSGDTIVSNGSSWVVIPSGDEPSGTVTNVATGSGLTGGPITGSGTISHADTSSQASSTNSGRTYIQSISLDDFGHVTSLSTATETVTDTKVTQLAVPSHPEPTAYPLNVLLSYGDDPSDETNSVRKSYMTYSPETKALSTGGTVNGYTLNAASAKAVDTSISAASTSSNLPTSAAVASFVEGKGYVTSNTWRPIKYSTTTLNDASTTLEFEAGSNIGLAFSSGKLTISATDTTYGGDRGISLVSGNFGHSNSTVTAVTTAGLYKVKYDTYGHITGTTAVAKADITGLGIPESDTNTTYSLTVSGTGDNANKLGLTAGGSGSGTTWVTIPYATNAGTASSASSVAWANVSGHDAGVDADLGINTSSGDTTKFLNAKGGWTVPAGTYVHPAYDTVSAAAVKIGRDATGHVVIGAALTASDVGALASNTTYVSSVNGSSGAVTGIQTTGNLTTTISSSSTNAQYPSALAVYTALQNVGGAAVIFREWTA